MRKSLRLCALALCSLFYLFLQVRRWDPYHCQAATGTLAEMPALTEISMQSNASGYAPRFPYIHWFEKAFATSIFHSERLKISKIAACTLHIPSLVLHCDTVS